MRREIADRELMITLTTVLLKSNRRWWKWHVFFRLEHYRRKHLLAEMGGCIQITMPFQRMKALQNLMVVNQSVSKSFFSFKLIASSLYETFLPAYIIQFQSLTSLWIVNPATLCNYFFSSLRFRKREEKKISFSVLKEWTVVCLLTNIHHVQTFVYNHFSFFLCLTHDGRSCWDDS